jgi:putative addiction module killer protein
MLPKPEKFRCFFVRITVLLSIRLAAIEDDMANTLDRTEIFKYWLECLTDKLTKKRIEAHIKRAENGDFGDRKSVGEGVVEMRLHFGPGYRLYYFQSGRELYWLLIGGDKNTQQSDVVLAKAIKLRVQRGEKC